MVRIQKIPITIILVLISVLSHAQYGQVGIIKHKVNLDAIRTARTITTSGTLSAFTNTEGTASADQTFTVSGSNLAGNGTVTAGSGMEVAVGAGSYGSSQSIPVSSGTFTGQPITIHVRVAAATSAGSYSGNIAISSSGAVTKNVAYSATVSAPAAIVAKFFFTATSKTCSGWTNIFGNSTTGGGAIRTGTSNGIGVSTVSTSNWTGISGTTVNDNAGTTAGTFFSSCSGTENAVMRGYMFNNAAYNHSNVQLKITGLNSAKTYTIKMTGSTTVASRNLASRVEGTSLSSEQTVTITNNTANGITFTGISPNGSGELDIFIYRTTASGGAIGALEITEE